MFVTEGSPNTIVLKVYYTTHLSKSSTYTLLIISFPPKLRNHFLKVRLHKGEFGSLISIISSWQTKTKHSPSNHILKQWIHITYMCIYITYLLYYTFKSTLKVAVTGNKVLYKTSSLTLQSLPTWGTLCGWDSRGMTRNLTVIKLRHLTLKQCFPNFLSQIKPPQRCGI